MRILYILRGAPASGKSTWIEKNKLEAYTISPDAIRLLLAAPVMDKAGKRQISQAFNKRVWKKVYDLLAERMERGEFMVVDATHARADSFGQYKKLCEQYRYRPFVVDFSDVSLETLLERNRNREAYRQVPEDVIVRMAESLHATGKLSNAFTVLTPAEAEAKLHESLLFDYNRYEEVVVFGDIHGCYDPLRLYFEEHPFSENKAYILVGDYIDRGVQNREVVEFLLSMSKHKNVLLLEGNHEEYLRLYAEDTPEQPPMSAEVLTTLKRYLPLAELRKLEKRRVYPRVFAEKTAPQLNGLKKKDLRQLCRKFGQMAYIDFAGKHYFICHGGIPVLPDIWVSTRELIEGTGRFEETEALYRAWMANTPNGEVLIHGHRNVFSIPARVTERIYNLNTNIEVGEPLRVLRITPAGEDVLEIPCRVFDPECQLVEAKVEYVPTRGDNAMLRQLNESKLVMKRLLRGGLISYNFTRDVFYDKKWNDITCKARGLFVDHETELVACRSYDKFFNWDEVEATRTENLAQHLTFPVTAYRKENGFLGMISWDKRAQRLLVCSKSTSAGPFAELIRTHVQARGEAFVHGLEQYLSQHDVTLILECVDPVHDPHIIAYHKAHLYLLDIAENRFDTVLKPYEEVVATAATLGLEVKEKAYVFATFEELLAFKKHEDTAQELRYEGLVFCGANGFMVKYKSPFYKFWKRVRSLKECLVEKRTMPREFAPSGEALEVYKLMKGLQAEGRLEHMSVIDVERLYYGSENLRPAD